MKINVRLGMRWAKGKRVTEARIPIRVDNALDGRNGPRIENPIPFTHQSPPNNFINQINMKMIFVLNLIF